jgi:primosomal protein N'
VAGVFDYELPASLAGRVGAGHLVVVPFGNKTVQGVILRFVQTPAVEKTKSILGTLDPDPVLTPAQIALAEALSETTLSPLAAVVNLMLPPGLGRRLTFVPPRRPDRRVNDPETPAETAGRARSLCGRQIDRHFSVVEWRRMARIGGAFIGRAVLPAEDQTEIHPYAQLALGQTAESRWPIWDGEAAQTPPAAPAL